MKPETSQKSHQQSGTLSTPAMLGYCGGNLGKNILAGSLGLFQLYFMTDILGLAPALAGVLVLLALLWDALLDPLVGLWSDRVYNRFGKYGAFILLGAPLASASFLLFFFLPFLFGSDGAGFWLVLAALLLFRSCYTILDLPHNALIARISPDSRERGKIAVTRFFFSSLSMLMISGASFLIFSDQAGSGEAWLFAQAALVAAGISLAVMWLSWLSVARRDRAGPRQTRRESFSWQAHLAALQLGDVRLLLAAGMLGAFGPPTFMRMLPYMNVYVFADDRAVSTGLLAIVLGQLVSAPVWAWLSHRWNKATTMIAAHGLLILAMLAFLVTVETVGPIFWALTFVMGIAYCGMFSIVWGMGADVIDLIELRTGVRLEAILIGLLVLVMKAGEGLSGAAIGMGLDLAGFSGNSISDQGRSAIIWLACLIPIVAASGAMLCLFRYSLSHAEHARIRAALPG
ncbi:MFS transporter [Alterisphingorhabdus coralli]|uniref:MFS transporter n=1 Tax=Alterisphingorhabdus coralli TaxID=3071408 RepID=A0AA97F769_9SPHN|nr:MFS transporter [Parasphingorhabdus sp. SCSIO 66989]WOE75196.1 MFS transporter [Parasphingorhabdus sp. SCSIO 66989]